MERSSSDSFDKSGNSKRYNSDVSSLIISSGRVIGLVAISLTVKFTYDKIDRTNSDDEFSEKVA